jgi:hypothetical protein
MKTFYMLFLCRERYLFGTKCEVCGIQPFNYTWFSLLWFVAVAKNFLHTMSLLFYNRLSPLCVIRREMQRHGMADGWKAD